MVYRTLLRPALFRLPPETAHEIAARAIRLALAPAPVRRFVQRRFALSPFGPLERFGLTFANPVGLAAGFDKNGTLAPYMAALGFGFIEVGTVTRQAQPGNPRPRVFRLPRDAALINHMGFNNDGAAALVKRLARHRPACPVGVNIGKSRVVPVEEAISDYLASFEQVFSYADYVAVNVSSPNTPDLRELQRADALSSLLAALQERNRELAEKRIGRTLPLLVKLSPDLTAGELEMAADVALRAGVAGIIATNTTTSRAGLRRTPEDKVRACGAGGLSGAPLRERATAIIAALRLRTRGQIAIIGVGGIFSAADAWEKISAGASLVQLYTGLIYEGAGVARRINEGLAEILTEEGFRTLDEAVGCRAAELAAV